MPTQNSTSLNFEISPTGDLVFNASTGSGKSLTLTITNLSKDTLTIDNQILGGMFFTSNDLPVRIAPQSKDSSISISFFPTQPGDDFATMTIYSSLGDNVPIHLIGHATGPGYLYYNQKLNLTISDLRVKDSLWQYPHRDTLSIKFFSDGVDLTGNNKSGNYRAGNKLAFNFSLNNDQLTSGSTDNDDKNVTLQISLDTAAHLVTDISFSFDHYTHHDVHFASNPHTASDYEYSFEIKNAPYISYTDSSFEFSIKADQLVKSLIYFSAINSYESNEGPVLISLKEFQRSFPPLDSSEILISLRK